MSREELPGIIARTKPISRMPITFPINADTRLPFDPIQLVPLVEPGRHLGIFGGTGSGKTVALWWYLRRLKHAVSRREKRAIDPVTGKEEWALLHSDPKFAHYCGKGEKIVINDLGKLETLGLSQLYKLKLLLPEGAYINFQEEPGINYENIGEPAYFDPNDMDSLLPQLAIHRINVILLECFYHEPENWCTFWGGNREKKMPGFFAAIKEWQSQGKNDCPITIIYDQIDRIAPSRGHITYSGQTRVSSWLALNAGDFRSADIRLVGTAWRITDVNPTLVNDFSYLIFKQTTLKSDLSESFEKQFNAIRILKPYQMLIFTPQRNWDARLPLKMPIDPHEYKFSHGLKLGTKGIEVTTESEDTAILRTLLNYWTSPEMGVMNKGDVGIPLGWSASKVTELFQRLNGKSTEKSKVEDIKAKVAMMREKQATASSENE